MTEFSQEWAVSYLVALEKANGGLRGIAPTDIWRRAKGHDMVQVVQPLPANSCINTYQNFKQLTSRDYACGINVDEDFETGVHDT